MPSIQHPRPQTHIAAASIHRDETDIKSFTKLAEGGFNRVFEITMKHDDARVLARLPYPCILPKRLTVASEVATLDFLRTQGIPGPRVLEYSTDAETNSVGAEYIIMEKAEGEPIGESWYTLSEKQRLKVLMGLVKIEEKLFAIDLKASGSIYYAHDLPPEMDRVAISCSPSQQGSDTTAAARGEFCVGPVVSLKW
ncbi:hypothetical protein AJ80_09381 [Polytolypa hystricis UAMH7299]|uniref:Aminoglycoside phosphotransferase domain-containing protein n=1 Tax=Polytolypa hystricis (strain UAMH7299) TaxID=1447883 RepID=A0A2B7WIZ5_POLH7|nr:hypothetical protein AJ80_09381 [Polytolypa hystricis UAMH7299]